MRRSSKPDMTKWPDNGQPSSRHVWRVTWNGLDTGSGHAERCDRCGRGFNSRVDARGPIYCFPSREWMASNPQDNGMLGESRTAFG